MLLTNAAWKAQGRHTTPAKLATPSAQSVMWPCKHGAYPVTTGLSTPTSQSHHHRYSPPQPRQPSPMTTLCLPPLSMMLSCAPYHLVPSRYKVAGTTCDSTFTSDMTPVPSPLQKRACNQNAWNAASNVNFLTHATSIASSAWLDASASLNKDSRPTLLWHVLLHQPTWQVTLPWTKLQHSNTWDDGCRLATLTPWP